MTKGDVHLMKH